jgi:F420-dependent oxidoreductase-like protein
MPVHFGLQIPSFTFPERPGDNVYDVARDLAREAEREGFGSVWLMDHLFQIPVVAPETDPILECWTTLAALAEATTTVKLGTLVSAVGFRPPSIVAKVVATLDVISKGRMIAGLGAGWCDWETLAYGFPFPPTPERLQQLEDAVPILRAMWTEERATFEGRHFHVRNAICSPKPIQQPHVPIMIGGSGAKVTLRIVAEHAQAHNIGLGDAATCRQVLADLHGHCDRLGRDYDAIWKTRLTPIMFAESEADIQRRIDHLRPAAEPEDAFRARTLVGTVEQVTVQLQELIDAGIQGFVVSFFDADTVTPLRTLMREVAPKLR